MANNSRRKYLLCLLQVLFLSGAVAQKTLFPSAIPSSEPSGQPTSAPSAPTEKPTGEPTSVPSALPSGSPVAFVAQTYTGGAGDQNFTWYLPFDAQTYSAYSTHWISSHESWMVDQYDASCTTQNTLPVCVDGSLLEDPSIKCPTNGCMRASYAVDPCQATPLDTVDYIPPPLTSAGVSAANQCLPTSEESFLLPPYYSLDAGLPPLYSPLKSVNLQISGNIFGRTGNLCTNMSEVTVDYWHVKTDLLPHAYDEFYNPPEEVPLGQGEAPPDELAPSALRDVSCRGEATTSQEGTFSFLTTLPPSYGPPRHINIRIQAPGYETLITRVYLDKDLRLQQLVYDGDRGSPEENHDLREEELQSGLQNSFRLKESLHFGPNQVEYNEGFLHFGEEMKKHLNKDPRVAEVEFVPSQTVYLDNQTQPHFKGRFEARLDLVLRPLRSLQDSNDSPANAYNLTGLWRDDETGGLVKVER
jgi:protocatechuate 3,4-dioxygenase beta subunit